MSRPNCLCIVEVQWIMILSRPSSSLRLPCSARVRNSRLMNMHTYRATVFRENVQFCSDSCHKIHDLNGHKWYVNKNTSSVIMLLHLLSFCQQNIAKSNGHFSKMDGDLSKHRQGFAIHFIQPHASRLAYATCPAGHKQLLSPSFRRCITEPCIGNTVPFIHAYSCPCTTINLGSNSL